MHWYVSYLYSCRLVWTACLSTASITLKNMQFSSSESQCSITDSYMMNLPFFRCTVNKQGNTGDGWWDTGAGAWWVDLTASRWVWLCGCQLVNHTDQPGLLWTLICRESALHVWIPREDAGGAHSLWDVTCSEKYCLRMRNTTFYRAFNTSCFWRILWPILRTILLKSLGSARFLKYFWK